MGLTLNECLSNGWCISSPEPGGTHGELTEELVLMANVAALGPQPTQRRTTNAWDRSHMSWFPTHPTPTVLVGNFGKAQPHWRPQFPDLHGEGVANTPNLGGTHGIPRWPPLPAASARLEGRVL